MPSNIIKIDRNLVVEELYKIVALVDPTNSAARRAVMDLVNMVSKAPVDETNRQYARINTKRG